MIRAKPGGRAAASGHIMTTHDAAIAEKMIARGDRDHDIVSWFGLNPGRLADVKDGKFGPLPEVDDSEVPPAGSPGPKARRLIKAIHAIEAHLKEKGAEGIPEALERIERSKQLYYKAE